MQIIRPSVKGSLLKLAVIIKITMITSMGLQKVLTKSANLVMDSISMMVLRTINMLILDWVEQPMIQQMIMACLLVRK